MSRDLYLSIPAHAFRQGCVRKFFCFTVEFDALDQIPPSRQDAAQKYGQILIENLQATFY
jgi:hypothetical protein